MYASASALIAFVLTISSMRWFPAQISSLENILVVGHACEVRCNLTQELSNDNIDLTRSGKTQEIAKERYHMMVSTTISRFDLGQIPFVLVERDWLCSEEFT